MARSSSPSPDNILHFLQLTKRPTSADEIASALAIRKADRRSLFDLLGQLKRRRAVEELPGGLYRLPGRKSEPATSIQPVVQSRNPAGRPPAVTSRDQLTGRLVLHHDGYGFVVLDSPMPQLSGDVFIPRDAIEDAMHGDRVQVRIARIGGIAGAQRAEGRIVRILGRAHPSVVGLFRYGPRGNVVLPYDVRMQHEVEIPPGYELTSGLTTKLGLSGSGEKSARAKRMPRLEELDGAVVNVELLRYPRGGAAPTGRVIEILGRPGDLGVDTEIIIRKHHLPHVFATRKSSFANTISLMSLQKTYANKPNAVRNPCKTQIAKAVKTFASYSS